MNVGGQAVIEGVMMRSSKLMATAVRLEDGSLRIRKEAVKIRKGLLSRLFFFRGIIKLYDMLKVGYSVLNWSAEQQLDEKPGNWFTIITTIISFIVAIFLFKFIPYFLATLSGFENLWLFNFTDGTIKIIMLVSYLLIIGKVNDVKRTFQFHAAEHKSIACWEAKKELIPEEAQKFRKEHPRCGTNFLFIVIMVSIVVYLFIPLSFGFWQNFALRLLLLPVIAGIAYEILKIGAKHEWIAYPGMLLQKLTTFEPEIEHLEVGLAALKEVLEE